MGAPMLLHALEQSTPNSESGGESGLRSNTHGVKMKLGIVGHGQEKFTPETELKARRAIGGAILRYWPTYVVSGHSPMGGVDLYAEEEAYRREFPTIIHAPIVHQWDGPGGFRDRNLKIAAESDLILVVVVRELPHDFQGMRFEGECYHCRGRVPPHVKSGGCWTAWKAKEREWVII